MKKYYEKKAIKNLELNETTFDSIEFLECRFENCDIENSLFRYCKFTDCIFSKCRIINPIFDNCSMTSSNFIECRLFGVNWNELESYMVSPIEHLQKCQIKYNNFVGENYSKFLFEYNDILESLFADCNLENSNFSNCNLDKTEFFRCNLKKASFENSYGYIVDVLNCNLKEAVFSFPEVTNLLNGLGIVIK